MEKVDDLLTLPAEWVWPIDHLQTAARVRPGIADSAAALNNLQSLRDKETQETRQVFLQ